MSWTNKSIERYEEQLREQWTVDGRRRSRLDKLPDIGIPITSDLYAFDPIGRGVPFVMTSKESLYDKYPERAENTREICGND